MAGFNFFNPLFDKFDSLTATFVTDVSAKLITILTPVLMAGLAISFIVYSLAIIRGVIDTPLSDYIWRCFRIGVIVSIASAGGLYQSAIADAIVHTPDDLAAALVADPASTHTAGNILDAAAEKGYDVAAKAFDQASFFSGDGLTYMAFGVLAILASVALAGIGGAFLILAKVAIAILVALGPLFIFALLWQATHRFFELWTAQILNYGLLIVLCSAVFMLLMKMFGDYMEGIQFDGVTNVVYALGGACMISVVSVLLLLQMPSIAAGLAGGAGLSYMWEMRMLRGGVEAGLRAPGGAYRGARTAVQAASSGARVTAKGIQSVGGGARRIAGYARGRLAA